MKKILLALSVVSLFAAKAHSQGCVAIRSTGGICSMTDHPDSTMSSEGSWVFNANNRYFKSFRHFRGSEEQKERLEANTEVINHQYALDLSLMRVFNNRWSAMIDIPVLANGRSSLYEHGGKERHKMHSFGLGDIRFAVYRWLLNPEKSRNFNAQLGLGLKLPTGDFDYQDYYYNVGVDGAKELRTVDQSIQLGDGGTGISAELNLFANVAKNTGVYGNFYYLSNPRGHNGVKTFRSSSYEAIMSVPDQYMARAGVNYAVGKLIASAGARLEGIPVYDLIGGSGAFRRPGYIWSVEPGLTYQFGRMNVYAAVPAALYRKRTQSVPDKERTEASPTKTRVNGDAAFADYSVNIGVSFKL
ncbi:MAG: hypothetical protein V4594_17270 [Bacteroidota bacterium]